MTDEEPGDAGRRATVEPGVVAKDTRKEWQKPDASKGWKTIIDTMTEYDSKMVRGWKDELGNLLIFVCPTSRSHLYVHQMSEVSTNLRSNRPVSSLQS